MTKCLICGIEEDTEEEGWICQECYDKNREELDKDER